MNTFLLPLIAGLFGLLIGSFLNVCIVRLPKDESIVTPRSHCPKCGHMIEWYENIPLASYAFLGGRCKGCGVEISWLYPAIELSTGLLFAAVALFFGPSIATPKFCVFAALMLALTIIDLRDRILPDELTLAGLLLGVAFSLVTPVGDGSAFWIVKHLGAWPWQMTSAFDALLGAAAGGGSLWLVREGYYWLRKVEGMGFGDLKLMAAVGAFLGLKATFLTIFLGAGTGALIGGTLIVYWRRGGVKRLTRRGTPVFVAAYLALRRARYELPFGTFLGAAAMIAVFWGKEMVEWYTRQLS